MDLIYIQELDEEEGIEQRFVEEQLVWKDVEEGKILKARM
jgi:hypothetical protein